MKLLAVAQFLYGEHTRQAVFDPLVADAQDEIGRSRIPSLARLQWQLAIVRSLFACSPRLFSLPPALLIDLVVRGALFGALAFALQLMFIALGRRGVPATFAQTLPFIIMPVVWRLRVARVPHYQQRTLAMLLSLAAAAMTAVLSDGTILMRLAAATMPLVVAFVGWRSADPDYDFSSRLFDAGDRTSITINSILMRGILIGCGFHVAAWLPRLGSGQDFFAPYYPGRLLFLFLIGIAISASIVNRWHVADAHEAAAQDR